MISKHPLSAKEYVEGMQKNGDVSKLNPDYEMRPITQLMRTFLKEATRDIFYVIG